MLRTMLLAATALLLPTLASAGPVTDKDLRQANDNKGEWLLYGRDYRAQRFSPLAEITPANVGKMQPVWTFSTGGKFGGLEATPLFRDGVLYFTADSARVFAVDARTGLMKWKYEPNYADGLDAMLCCGPINRGLAMAGDRVFVATLDARLVALDRADGKVAWEVAVDDWKQGLTETGAPLVVGDSVIIGISGGEYGVRGYLKSYSIDTGKLNWTTYTIPAPGEKGSETWPKDDSWKTGGGPTWLTGSYDVDTDTLFWGTGNPGSWQADQHPGDNLFTNCLLALDPHTGAIKWHFQYTPNDGWDYDGIGTPILADIKIKGKPVKAALESNRNGFFYVIDRTNGNFIYAVPTIEGINWTKGIDPETGKPAINEDFKPKADGKQVQPIVPGLEGGTNWFPPAYDPEHGIAFIATNDWAMGLTSWEKGKLEYKPGTVYQGVDYQMYRTKPSIGHVKALDVATGKFIWDSPNPLPLFSGLLATKSGLVFTGDQRGFMLAYDAKTGKELWQFQTGSSINASPITYQLDGKQYVAILSGLGGDPSFYYHEPKGGALWVFAVDGKLTNAPGFNVQIDEKMLPDYKPQ